MFSKELEDLIDATLQDGILEDHEKKALVKRALLEGADLDELDIYINSKLQKRIAEEKISDSRNKKTTVEKKDSNRCPQCGSPIPPLSKTCPCCGAAVAASTSGDSELFALIDAMEQSLVRLKTTNIVDFKKEKANIESYLRKSKLFYGDNKKVQMLVFDQESKIAELSKINRRKALASNTVYYIIMAMLFLMTISTIWFGLGIIPLALMVLYYMHHNKKFLFAKS